MNQFHLFNARPNFYALTFYICFFQRENDKLVKGNKVSYFIESHYNDFVHISFDSANL